MRGTAERVTFAGRTALVTGAGRGIGRSIALLFGVRGANVVVADVDQASAIGTTRDVEGNAVAVAADVTNEEGVAAMVRTAVDRFGGLDYAVNNAGIAPDPKPFTDHALADWQRTIDVDLTGVFLCMQHELRQLVMQGRGGAIVNISSAAGTVPAPGQPQYTAAKHGVLGLTKQAAQEYAGQGIRVNAVMPGQTETAPMQQYLEALPDRGERMLKRLPMGRMATTDEVAQAVVWLCSDDASYVNGVSLLVDGGLIAR
jgi:NAD(P)-dependent dehydrogenase (short-subunit alcohol dehydrogenase family)